MQFLIFLKGRSITFFLLLRNRHTVLHTFTGVFDINIDLQATVLVKIQIKFLPVSKVLHLYSRRCLKATGVVSSNDIVL
jgi:hypothetical protein